MRSRNIKPGFFRNESLATLPPLTRILFQGLWCIADRAGRLENRPRRIKADILPYDDCDPIAMLQDLNDLGFIQFYGEYIQITNFSKHQNPHKNEVESKIPPSVIQNLIQEYCASTVQAPDKNDASMVQVPNFSEPLRLIPDSLIPDSPPLSPHGGQESLALAIRLRDWIVRNNGEARVPQSTADLSPWSAEINRMITADKRAPPKIGEIIDWCQKDPFWRANILSPKKLRQKFDQLILKSQSKEQTADAGQLYEWRKKEGRCTTCGTTQKIKNGIKYCEKCDHVGEPIDMTKLLKIKTVR